MSRIINPFAYTAAPGGGDPSPLLTDLVGYWKLDEASGTRNDSHGSNHMTDNNTVTQAAGKIGNAAQFTRANSEYLSCADNASISTGDIDFTLSAWVYLDDKPTGENGYIFGKGNGVNDEFDLIYNNYSGQDEFALFITAYTIRVGASNFGSPSLGTWNFVVGWHDATADTINIQVNNGAVNSTSTGGVPPGDNSSSLDIGGLGGTPFTLMNGRNDECGFWKRVLTADERTALYNSGNGLSYPF